MRLSLPSDHDPTPMRALRDVIVRAPVDVGLDRAATFTRVWRENENAPRVIRKAMALREHLRTIPLYLRPGDRIAGAISERPGAMPLFPEIGIGENSIYLAEHPERRGYLRGKVPADIHAYWDSRNLWGRYRGYSRAVEGRNLERTEVAPYHFISHQGHLSPSYRELLRDGINGIRARVERRRAGELLPAKREWLTAAALSLEGLSAWIERYADFVEDDAKRGGDAARSDELREMARIAARIAHEPPQTFREALQLVWFVQQAIHIEGHGYSNTPDRLDQLLLPFYQRDCREGRLRPAEALSLCENFILKQRDNTFWGIEHNLTQGLVVGGSAPDGTDQTNELSWLFLQAAANMSVPEPLVWARWHSRIDPDFFDFCLETLGGSTCFPLFMNDAVVAEMFMALGVHRDDAFDYVPVGCNELGIPGKAYFNPGAGVGYPLILEAMLTAGRGYNGARRPPFEIPGPSEMGDFETLMRVVERLIRHEVESNYRHGVGVVGAQMQWGQSPLTSCFFDGCIERGQDLVQGTKYNILSCGGAFFPNLVDGLAAIREVVFEKRDATLAEVAAACASNFEGKEDLRRRLAQAPKHGNDDPRLEELIDRLERFRDEAVRDVCRDPRDGTPFGSTHIVRSSAVTTGRVTPATPDGRKAGQPLASSIAACAGAERSGPTALLNSVCRLHAARSWQCGYNVNVRLQPRLLTDPAARTKTRALLTSYFERGGQELQVNAFSSEQLRAAQREPDAYRDLVVRVAGFSETFVNLHRDLQEELIARTEHNLG